MEPGNNDENTPLLVATPAPFADSRPRNSRTVTFSPDPVTRTIEPEPHLARSIGAHHHAPAAAAAPPVLAALNNKIRRRYSHGAAPAALPPPVGSKIGPQRSTKKTEKLKLLPNPDLEDGEDEESGRDVYSQYTRIKDPNARRDAARLGKSDRSRLPRVTAYCTANRYDMDGLMRFLKGRGKARGANPKLIDECIYTPYAYTKPVQAANQPSERTQPRRHSTGGGSFDDDAHLQAVRADLHDSAHGDVFVGDGTHHDANAGASLNSDDGLMLASVAEEVPVHGPDILPDFDVQVHTPEVFLFDYGVIVVWGMLESQEARFLRDIAKFEVEKLAPDDVETEHFNFYYTREYQARIYNDFITLRDKHNYMTKLAISHALAQSVKVRLPLSSSRAMPLRAVLM